MCSGSDMHETSVQSAWDLGGGGFEMLGKTEKKDKILKKKKRIFPYCSKKISINKLTLKMC